MSFPSVLVRLSLVGAVVGAAQPALAARIAVLVPSIDSTPKFTDGKRNKFHDTLTKGMQDEAGVSNTVVSADEVRQKLGVHTLLGDCQSGPCLSQVATKLAADRLVVSRIAVKSAIGGSSYTIEMAVYDQAGTALAITGSEKCGDESDGCNLSRAFEALRRASANVAGQLMAEKAPSTRPVDKPAPTTPAPLRLPEPQLKDPSAPEAGPPAMLPQAQTQPPPAAPTYDRPYNPGYRYGWIASAAAGGALLLSSIPFFYFASLEGQTNCGPTVPRNQCPQVYQGNLGPALGLSLTGALGGAAAFGVLFYLDKRQTRRLAGQF